MSADRRQQVKGKLRPPGDEWGGKMRSPLEIIAAILMPKGQKPGRRFLNNSQSAEK